jgi:D-sedoheptulose 7-phosphate isomerase
MSLQHPPKEYIERFQQALTLLDHKKINLLAEKLRAMQGVGRKLFLAGNGGSAATASHAACDLGKTVHTAGPNGSIKALCLNDNIPLLTAWGNDAGYEHVFSEQLRNFATAGDLFIPITASGNSPNIVQAIKVAKDLGVETFGLLGFVGGHAKGLLDDYLLIESQDYGVVEDAHMMVIHAITDALKHG